LADVNHQQADAGPTLVQPQFSLPRPGAHLDGLLGAAKRRGAGEVKVADRVHGHAMEERGAVYARGLDILLGTYRRLELTPPGRPPHVTEFPCPVTYDHQS
jgi:predicted dithiol-disulfide oxidoreductase (DUF899 family)